MARQPRFEAAHVDPATSQQPDPQRQQGSRQSRRSRRSRRSSAIVIVAAIAVLGAGIASALVTSRSKPASPQPPQPPGGKILATPSPQAAGYFVTPNGNGDCVSSPCGSIGDAVAKAKAARQNDAIVELAAGRYPEQTIDEAKQRADAGTRVVVRAAKGASVTVDRLTINAAHVTIRGLTFTGAVTLGSDATGSGLDGVTTRGGAVFLAASQSFVTNSAITPPVDSDGIQIKAYDGKNPDGVTVEHTTVGPTHRGPKRTHVDCIQILGGSDITIRYSRLFHCADQGIIAGAGASGSISGTINVERTQVQLCPKRTSDCDGYNAINIKAPKVVFVHNTVIDGAAVFKVDDLTVAANYFESLKTCDGTIEGNLVAATSCDPLPPGNKLGKLQFADDEAQPPDLTPRHSVVLPGASEWVGGAFAADDADGRAIDPKEATVGAIQVGGSR